jgi:chromosome segregation ATPase
VNALDQIIAELEQLDVKASPAPWEAVCLNDWTDATYVDGADFASSRSGVTEAEIRTSQDEIHATARLIAALRNGWPVLRDAIRELKESLATSTSVAFEEGDGRAALAERLSSVEAAIVAEAETRAPIDEQLADAAEELKALKRTVGEFCDWAMEVDNAVEEVKRRAEPMLRAIRGAR